MGSVDHPLRSVVFAVGVALLVAGCSSVTHLATTSPTTTAEPTTRSTPSSTTTEQTTPASTTTQSPPAVENLVADATVRQDLLTAFSTFRSDGTNTPGFAAIPQGAVGSIQSGSLYYAFIPSSSTYWAMASFDPTAAASQTSASVGFQDGGSTAVFARTQAETWTVKYVGWCLTGLPAAVAAVWGVKAPSAFCS